MKKLLAYLNGLTSVDQDRFAKNLRSSINYLRKAISTGQKFRAEFCVDIERATNGLVTCEELRPDLTAQWQYLRNTKKA